MEKPDPHEFVFELDRAIREQVVEKLESLPSIPLSKDVAPKLSGIYVLYDDEKLVYIGKASKGKTQSKRTLRDRLNEHLRKVSSRQNLSLEKISCRFLTIKSEWFVWAAEFALIEHYKPLWNKSGFGSKTPGKGRPGTDRVSRWDQEHPPITNAISPQETLTDDEDDQEDESED